MRITFAATVLLLLGAMLLLQPSPPVTAQEPAALTPSPEPPSPTPQDTSTPVLATPTPTPGGPVSPPPPPPPYPGPATATPRPGRDEPVADLALSKSVTPLVALPGELLTFTITLVNRSADRADGVVVTDALPGVLGVYNATTTRGLISVSGSTVRVDIGRLEAGEEVGITVVAQVNAAPPPGGYANRASVITSTEDRDSGDNAAQASFTVGQQATPVPPTPTVPATPPPATPPPVTPVPATPVPPDNCVRTAAGGEPLPTCTPLPGTPAPRPTATSVPAPPVPQQLPDTGVPVLDVLGVLLVATGALGLGLALRRKGKLTR